METVQSTDGTKIAVQRSGSGPALVPVLGAFNDRASAAPFVDSFADAYTVVRYDRRGRGDSGDTEPYAIEREVEDLGAVITAIGEPAFVFGHSSGAALALEAAAGRVEIRKLVVYEPPYVGDGGGAGAEFADRLAELSASGRRSEVAEAFILNTGASPEQVEQMKKTDSWPRMEAMAHTLAYDVRLCNGGSVPTERLANVSCPTIAYAGGSSSAWAPAAAEAIAAAVQDGEFRVLDGHGHGPPVEVLAPALIAFFV